MVSDTPSWYYPDACGQGAIAGVNHLDLVYIGVSYAFMLYIAGKTEMGMLLVKYIWLLIS